MREYYYRLFYLFINKHTEQKTKEGFLTPLEMAMKKEPITSMRKDPNELKVHKNIVRTAIKQDLSPLITLYGGF